MKLKNKILKIRLGENQITNYFIHNVIPFFYTLRTICLFFFSVMRH